MANQKFYIIDQNEGELVPIKLIDPGDGSGFSFATGMSAISTTTVTIASGQSLGSAVDLAHAALIRIQMSTAWTTANLTLQTSTDGLIYQDAYDSYGVEYTIVAVAAHNIILPPLDFIGMRYLKLRSGTAGSPVVQTADRTLTLVIRPIA